MATRKRQHAPKKGTSSSGLSKLSPMERELILEIVERVPIAIWAASGREHDYAVRLWSPGAEQLYGYSKDEMLGTNYIEKFVNVLERTQAKRDHARVERTQGAYRNLALDVGADGKERMVLTQGFSLWHPDLDQYVQAEVAVGAFEFEQEVDWLAKVREASRHQRATAEFLKLAQAALSSPVEQVISIAAKLLKDYSDASGQVEVWREDGEGELGLEQGSGRSAASLEYREQSLVRWCLNSGQTLLVDYVTNQPPASSFAPHSVGFPRRLKRFGDRAAPFVVVPLADAARAVGGVLTHFKPGTELSEADLDLVRMIAWGITLAWNQRDKLSALERDAALQAEERERQAIVKLSEQYLHDVTKKAALLNLIVDVIDEDGSPTTVRRAIPTLRSIAQQLMSVLEDSAAGLEPIIFDASEMLNSLAGRFSLQYGDVDIEREIHDGLFMRGVKPFIEGAIENFLLNSVEAMQGRGRLRIGTVKRGRTRTSARSFDVVICDEGPGLTEGQIGKVGRQRFSTKGARRGSGLQIAVDSIEQAGGSWSYLEGGRGGFSGACWEIRFPLRTPPVP